MVYLLEFTGVFFSFVSESDQKKIMPRQHFFSENSVEISEPEVTAYDSR